MRPFLVVAFGFLLLWALPAPAQNQSGPAYKIDIDPKSVTSSVVDRPDRKGLYITLSFKLTQTSDNAVATNVDRSEIRIDEDGQPVEELEITQPKAQNLNTVLVLDCSGSMRAKANDRDKNSKLDALKDAAGRFVNLMQPTARATLVPFSSTVESPGPFSNDHKKLEVRIDKLKAEGGTLLYDATLVGVETLVAARLPGRNAVIVLTDGKDEAPGSRHSDDLVIARAKEERIPLYMLGLGRPQEIAGPVMQRMAAQTGGKYFHAPSEDDLRKIFEELAVELQSTYTATFKSRKQSHDGTARGIDIRVVRGDKVISDVASVDYSVHGVVVVPDMNPRTYFILFILLGGLGLLLALPAVLGKVGRSRPAA